MVTIRLDQNSKTELEKIAQKDVTGHTVSSLIDLAVREYLEHRVRDGKLWRTGEKLRVRHAPLPDASVLKAFHVLAPDRAKGVRNDLNLPDFDFGGSTAEWRRLPAYLKTRDAELVECLNWSAIFSLIKKGESSPALDWIGPFLQLFVGHHVFIRKDQFVAHLGEKEAKSFEQFRSQAKSGRELSLRSVLAWARQPQGNVQQRAEKLRQMWAEAVVACQLGTDYQIAVWRVAPILAGMQGNVDTPLVQPVVHGFDNPSDFQNGAVSGFSGNLLHSATLLADPRATAYLLAGPADLRIPSLNVLAGQKEMFAARTLRAGKPSLGEKVERGDRVLQYWGTAVRWFREEVVMAASHDKLQQFIKVEFPWFLGDDTAPDTPTLTALKVLQDLLQTWVRWFADPEEASDFLGTGNVGDFTTEDLVQHYEYLCTLLNPVAEMTAPDLGSPKERALWKFPTLGTVSGPASLRTGVAPAAKRPQARAAKKLKS